MSPIDPEQMIGFGLKNRLRGKWVLARIEPGNVVESSLGNGVMVLHCPLGVPSGRANAGRPKRGVAHAQHSKLGRQPVQV